MAFNPTKFRNVAKNDLGEMGNLTLLFLDENAEDDIYDISEDSSLIEFISNGKKAESFRYDDSHYVRYILYVYNNGILNRHIKDGYIKHEKNSNLITILNKGKKHIKSL
ncbi:MAG: hypothetical protein QM489_02860 [Candidatus Izemoplasma sp.]